MQNNRSPGNDEQIKEFFLTFWEDIKDVFLNSSRTAKLKKKLTPPCGFSKNLSSKERVKPWFFVTFNIIIRHVFPENFIEIPQEVQKL